MNELLALLKGEFKIGKIESTAKGFRISAVYDSQSLDVELSVTLDSNGLIEVVKKVIPGSVDDFILDLIKTAIAIKSA